MRYFRFNCLVGAQSLWDKGAGSRRYGENLSEEVQDAFIMQ